MCLSSGQIANAVGSRGRTPQTVWANRVRVFRWFSVERPSCSESEDGPKRKNPNRVCVGWCLAPRPTNSSIISRMWSNSLTRACWIDDAVELATHGTDSITDKRKIGTASSDSHPKDYENKTTRTVCVLCVYVYVFGHVVWVVCVVLCRLCLVSSVMYLCVCVCVCGQLMYTTQ